MMIGSESSHRMFSVLDVFYSNKCESDMSFVISDLRKIGLRLWIIAIALDVFTTTITFAY